MSEKDETIRQKAALLLIEAGQITITEAAKLRGISRQTMHYQAAKLGARLKRQKYLRTMWKEVVERLTG